LFLWRVHERGALVAASIPPIPDLTAWTDTLGRPIKACELRATSGPAPVAALAELNRLHHANGIFREAMPG